MEIGIRVDTENIQEGASRHTNSSYFTMVAVDSDGKPVTIAPRPLHTDLDTQRFESARSGAEPNATPSPAPTASHRPSPRE